LKIKINKKARISSWLCLILHLPQASGWRRDTKNYGSLRSIGLLCCLWNPNNTMLIIELCKEHDTEFQSGVKKYIWQKIAREISEKTKTSV
jgi:hypothetical protein